MAGRRHALAQRHERASQTALGRGSLGTTSASDGACCSDALLPRERGSALSYVLMATGIASNK